MKNNLEKVFKNIHTSEKIDQIIMNKTINKKKGIILYRRIAAISIFFIVCIVSIGIVFADEIKDFIKSYYVEKTIDLQKTDDMHMSILMLKNRKEINYDANFEEYHSDTLNPKVTSFENIEKEFNINILKTSELLKKNVNISDITKFENKIASANFTIFDAAEIDNQNNKITYGFSFITNYYNNGEKEVLLGAGRKSSEENITIIYNDKLNTDIYFWTAPNVKDEDIVGTVLTHFIYDDILYEITAYHTSRSKILNFINSLRY